MPQGRIRRTAAQCRGRRLCGRRANPADAPGSAVVGGILGGRPRGVPLGAKGAAKADRILAELVLERVECLLQAAALLIVVMKHVERSGRIAQAV